MNHSQIKGSVGRLFKVRNEKKVLHEVEEEEKRNISNYMYCNGLKEMEVLLDDDEQLCVDPILVKVKKLVSTTVVFDTDKLKERLGKEIYNDIVDTEYQVTDIEGLIEYLKECGVSPKKFKKHIKRKDTLNKERFDKYYEFGDIKMEDVKGCYSVKKSSPSIRVTEVKGGNKS